MKFDADKVRANARQAETDDLLDRVTVYRDGMEPEALDILEAELRARGVSGEEIERHGEESMRDCLRAADGSISPCSFCRKPAVAEAWAWHRLWGVVPVIPRRFRYCRACRSRLGKPHDTGETC